MADIFKPVRGKVITKSQQTLLSRSLMIAALGFGLIALFAWLIQVALFHMGVMQHEWLMNLLLVASIIGVIASSITFAFQLNKFFAQPNEINNTTLITMMLVYTLAEGASFGVLFTSIQYMLPHQQQYMMQDILGVFIVAAVVFITAGAIGFVSANKENFGLMKFMGILSIALVVLIPIILLSMFVFNITPFMIVLYGIMALLMICYIIYDFIVITRLQTFVQLESNNVTFAFCLLFGFKLLSDFIGLFWTLLQLVMALRRD